MFEQFIFRLLALTCLLILIAVWDYSQKRAQAQRWREYLKLYACAGIASVFGALNDIYTVSISPDYFAHGKGLGAGEDLTIKAVLLGAQAGCVAGFVCGGCLLIRFKQLAWSPLLRRVAVIISTALVCSQIGAYVYPLMIEAKDLFSEVDWSSEREAAFMQVWGMHIGLYAGALIGLIGVCLKPREKSDCLS